MQGERSLAVLLVLLFVWAQEQVKGVQGVFIPVTGADLHGNVVSVRNLLVSYEHKKSGSTLWTQFMCRVNGDPHWYEPPWHKGLPTVRGKSREHIEQLLNDPNWTKAIFLRDPSRRLLSSYHFCIKSKGSNSHLYLEHMKKMTKSKNTSWEHFYSSVVDPNIRLQNLHWRPQGDFCRFKKFHPLFQFVGNMERMQSQGKDLLLKLGLWDKYGANEWSLAKVIKKSVIADHSKNRYNFRYPENYNKSDCMFCSNNSPHKSSYVAEKHTMPNRSHSLNSSDFALKHYLRLDTWKKIRFSSFYAEDYALFEKLNATPFEKSLYLNYPPPSLGR